MLPLHNLVLKLREHGFVIRPDDYIELLKVVETFGIEGKKIEAAHLCPLIATSPEEQERFYKVFTEYSKEPIVPPVPTPNLGQRLHKVGNWLLKHRAWVLMSMVVAAAIVALVLLTAKTVIEPIGEIAYTKTSDGDATLRVGDSVTLDASQMLPSGIANDTLVKFFWNTGDGFKALGPSTTMALTKEGNTNITLKIQSGKYRVRNGSKSLTLSACAAAPQVQFSDLKNSYSIGDQLVIQPTIQGSFYKAIWKINDSVVQPRNDLSLHYSFRSVGEYEVQFFGLLSAADNENSPCIYRKKWDKIVIADDQYTVRSSNRGAKLAAASSVSVLPALCWLLALPVLLINLATWLWWRKNRKGSAKKDAEEVKPESGSRKPPYDLPFENKDLQLTESESEFRQVYQAFRQKAEDELTAFNVVESIRQTIRTGGLPELVFTQKLRYTDYVVLIDYNIAKSMQVRLFDYLVNRLNEEAINVERFYFTGRFEKIFNEETPDGYSLKRLAELYKSHTLIVMGKAHQVVYDAFPILDKQLSDLLQTWEYKAILTSVPYKDWGEKESLLAQSFILLPADLAGQLRLLQAIREKNLDHKKYLSSFESFYETEFLDFNRTADLKEYLQDEVLYQWICATAIYHSLRWELLIEIGKAICTAAGLPEKMNFTNLLKLSRIKWMNEGSFPAALRLEMLKELSPENEAIARNTLLQMLQYAETYFGAGYFFDEEKGLQQITNQFLLYAHNPVQYAAFASSEADFKTAWESGRLWDAPQRVYLENPDGRWSTLLQWKGKRTGVDEYFRAKKTESLKSWRRVQLLNAGATLLFVLLVAVVYLMRDKLPPYSFLVSAAQQSNSLAVQVVYNDSCGSAPARTYTGRLQLDGGNAFELSFNNAGFTTVSLPANLIDAKGLLQIEWNDGIPSNVSSLVTLATDTLQTIISSCQVKPRYAVNVYYDDSTRRQEITDLYSSLRQQGFQISSYTLTNKLNRDTTTTVSYYDDADRAGADSLAQYLSLSVGGVYADAKVLKEKTKPTSAEKHLELRIHFNRNSDAPVLTKFDTRLNEIWHGGTSNRLIAINFPTIYYSTGDKKTYGTYRITEVWQMKDNVFKIITQAYPQYAVFFVRNVRSNGFELSVCQNRYNTKEEAQAITDANCDHFNSKTLYYENDNSKIFLPMLASENMESSNTAKFRQVFSQHPRGLLRVFYNSNYGYNASGNLPFDIQRRNLPTINATLKKTTPFDRSYFQYEFSEGVENAFPEDPCKTTYASLTQVKRLKSLSLVCILDLSNQRLTSIPADVYNMPNLKWLDLRKNNIDTNEIIKLRFTKPLLTVLYDPTGKPIVVTETKERLLSTLNFDAKYLLEGESKDKLYQIFQHANSNPEVSVRVVIYSYYTRDDNIRQKQERAYFDDILQAWNVKSFNQWKFETATAPSQQQYQTNSNRAETTNAVAVYGTNFPSDFMRGSTKY